MAARVVNANLLTTPKRTLSATEVKRAQRKLATTERTQPRRLVLLPCHGWRHDAVAVAGDWVWCDDCGDLSGVTEVR